MPPRDKAVYLWDVLNAAKAVLDATRGKTLADYGADRLLRRAVERELEIIGEALNRAEKRFPDIRSEVSHFAGIVALRNRLIHGYFSVDDRVVWGVVELFLPTLVSEVEALLGDDELPVQEPPDGRDRLGLRPREFKAVREVRARNKFSASSTHANPDRPAKTATGAGKTFCSYASRRTGSPSRSAFGR